MRGGSARSERGGEQYGFRDFFLAGAGLFRILRMNFDAINALRRVRHGDCDQFAIFARNLSVLSSDNSVESCPRLELLRGLAHLFAKPDESISEAVRVKIWKTSVGESFAKYRANWRGAAPVSSAQPRHFKVPIRAQRNTRRRENRVLIPPEFLFPEM